MPSAAARRFYEDQIPSFMSVFDLDAEAMADRETVTVVDPKLMEVEPSCSPMIPTDAPQLLHPNALPSESPHRHHDSTSTQTSESADSSPTTTVSCTDTSSLSDPSPSSSPDSPINPPPSLVPLSLAATSFAGLVPMAGLPAPSEGASSPERPMTSPSPRRPKNMKGLSIQPPFIGSMSANIISEPSSPSFIKPTIPAMKRKPSLLSLNTNTTDLLNRTTIEAPLSPGVPPILQRRALKHSTSSPHMLSALKSATFGPVGGMTIPTVLERNESGLSEFFRPSKPSSSKGFDSTIVEEDSPIRSQVANRAFFDDDDFHEIEAGHEDQKTPGYPDGPIAIYPDQNVYLYKEPTAEEASQFDLVINVAREVLNPFKDRTPEPAKQPANPLGPSPMPDTAMTNASFATAFEVFSDDITPTTPKATFPPRLPEYVHMPWDHNTDISVDLMTLCEAIDNKVKDGKKVLIHCQQGASRSASLIIAYGMFMNPDLSVNDAYYAAQARSRWISPNMRLMYCLQDFQKLLAKRRASPASAFSRPRTGRSPTKHRAALSVDAIDIPAKEPLSAPLSGENTLLRSASVDRSPLRPRGNSTPNRDLDISPGPSSAPSSFNWPGMGAKLESKVVEQQPTPPKLDDPIVSAPPKPAQRAFSLVPKPRKPAQDSALQPPPTPGFAPNSNPTSSMGFATIPPVPPSPGLPNMSSFPKLAPLSGGPSLSISKPTSSGLVSRRLGKQRSFNYLSLNLADSSRHQMSPIVEREVTVPQPAAFLDDSALMSPRAESMTNNPFRDRDPSPPADFAGLHFANEMPSLASTMDNGLFSPRGNLFARESFQSVGRPLQTADPRSPPTRGEAPIIRSIDEVL